MDDEAEFQVFVAEVRPRLARALVAPYGPERGQEALAEALAYAWEHFDEVRRMGNPGSIYLRQAGTAEHPLWVVVGAATDRGTIDDVRSDGRRVGFLVAPLAVTTDILTVRVWGGEDYTSVGGTPMQSRVQGRWQPNPASGEQVRQALGRPTPVVAPVDPGATVEILVRHVGGAWLSLTHMALQAPPAGP